MFKRLTAHLFYKIAILVVGFSVLLTAVIFYTVDYYYVEHDTLLDAHDLYFYSNLINSWDFPKGVEQIKGELDNLHIKATFIDFKDSSNIVWAHPDTINPMGYIDVLDSDDTESLHDVKNPIFVSFGSTIENQFVTYAQKDSFHIFLAIDEEYGNISPAYINYFPPIVVSIVFMVIFYGFIRRFLRPINLMKKRIRGLRDGDMKSKIAVLGNDELADLSESINKMISDIKILLSQKQQLLLDVSHELRSPLARMRLLVEMLPEHKNQSRLVDEIVFLEGMISNLLFSDKLSLPYSNLDCSYVKTSHVISKVIDLVNIDLAKISVENKIPLEKIWIDETKIIIALRNLIDNAFKYGDFREPIKINLLKSNPSTCLISVSNTGTKIDDNDLNQIFKPFFRSRKNSKTAAGFGLGLTICKKIIDAHNGHLKIRSNDQQTTFSIEIPCKKQ